MINNFDIINRITISILSYSIPNPHNKPPLITFTSSPIVFYLNFPFIIIIIPLFLLNDYNNNDSLILAYFSFRNFDPK